MTITSNYKTHGHAHLEDGRASTTYNAWRAMKQRCTCPSQKCYKNYGGRGITYCKRWDSFENFLADMGPKPQGMTLDRINNDGNYEPSNCRWATSAQQAANRRCSVLLTVHGQTKTITEWARLYGLHRHTIQRRLKKLRWTTEEAVTTPVAANGKKGGRKPKVKPDQVTKAMTMVFENAGLMTEQGVV